MNNEQIRDEFIKEIEAFIKSKRDHLNTLKGMEQYNALQKYLDELPELYAHMNLTANKIISENGVDFKNEEEFAKFAKFIEPTFTKMGEHYTYRLLDGLPKTKGEN
jgi:hypothetical protein